MATTLTSVLAIAGTVFVLAVMVLILILIWKVI